MPRVKLDPVAYKRIVLHDKIVGDMGRMRITRGEIGTMWGITPQAAGKKIRNMTMSAIEMSQLANKLDWSDEEIITAFKL